MDFASACARPTVRTSLSDGESGAEPESRHNIRVKGPTKQRFESIFTLGIRVKGECSRIIAYPGSGLVGIAVSKKVGSRPRRNKLKRRFRDAILCRRNQIDRRLDYVLIVNAEAAESPFDRVEEEVRMLFARIVERWAAESESS